MCRWILIVGFMLSTCAYSATAQSPDSDDTHSRIMSQLDEILERLDGIENRISKLERKTRIGRKLWTDEKGILRNSSGDAIGFWGIDGPEKIR